MQLTDNPESANPGFARKSYGRKRGKRLRTHRQQLIDEMLPQLALPTTSGALARPHTLFPASCEKTWLEIGFGDGGHLTWQAAANPDAGVIGCEPYWPGVASLLSRIHLMSLENVRVHAGDARDILALLPAASLDRAFILFPDPWPKKRHRKRRFISHENLDLLAQALKPGAELRFATDIDDYAEWTLRKVDTHRDFSLLAKTPADWPPTKYQTKAMAAGRTITYLRFERV